MRNIAKMLMRCSVASTVGLVTLFWSGDVQLDRQSSDHSTYCCLSAAPAVNTGRVLLQHFGKWKPEASRELSRMSAT